MSTSELACTYAALILHDDGLEITADNINTICKAAGVEVEGYWPALFAKLFAKKSMDDLITNVGAGASRSLTSLSSLYLVHSIADGRRFRLQVAVPPLRPPPPLPAVPPLLALLPRRRRRRSPARRRTWASPCSTKLAACGRVL